MTKSITDKKSKALLTDADLALFDEVFYFRHDELFQKIRDEEASVHAEIDALATTNQSASEELLLDLQKRLNRIKKVQKKVNDRQLDDFKELIYPGAKFVPALALFGLGGLSIVLGPTFALLFAAGFLTSNLLVKGKRSMLTVHFGIATGIQATAVVVGALILAGVSTVNPAVVTGLVVLGGSWLFGTAVLRGGLRQMEARDVKLGSAEKNKERLFEALKRTGDMVQSLSSENSVKHKLTEYIDKLIQSQLWQEEVKITPDQLVSLYGVNRTEAEALHNEIALIKVYYETMVLDLQDYENLLRTVKNPFEKVNRIRDIRSIEEKAAASDCPFELVKSDIVTKITETGDDIEFVYKKDVPWFVSNIALLGIAGACIPMVGMLLIGAPLIASPPVLITIGAIAAAVGLAYLYFHIKERRRDYTRMERDEEKRKIQDMLDLQISKVDETTSASLRKKTGTPMFIEKEIIEASPRQDLRNRKKEEKLQNEAHSLTKQIDKKK